MNDICTIDEASIGQFFEYEVCTIYMIIDQRGRDYVAAVNMFNGEVNTFTRDTIIKIIPPVIATSDIARHRLG